VLKSSLPLYGPELEPVRQSGSGPDKTGRKVHPAGRNRISFDFFAGLTSKMIRPDFCQIGVKNDPAGFRPDRTGQILKLAGPDRMQKIRPVPTLLRTWGQK
jgi:hypothetical protein